MRILRYACALALCIALLPSPAAADKIFNAQSFTLDNGLKVVVIPNHRAPVVTHMIWYKFGGADETAGKSGIAHFLEHLMFKGTPTVPDGQFSRIVKKLGGNDNAFTSQDFTAYYQNVPRAHLEKVMEMEADRMKNLTLREEEVASERQVIIEERRQRVDSRPQAKFQEQMMSTLFVNHPYGVPVIGWLHEIRELTRDDAFDQYNEWYAPNNAILIVSGDVTAKELEPLARKFYGPIPAQTVPERIRTRPAPIIAAPRLMMEDARIGQPVIMKTWRAPRGDDALDMLAEILGGTSTSRLYKRLVVERKLAISAGAGYEPLSLNDTTFSIHATPAPGVSLADMEAALSQEILILLDKGVTLEELNAAKGRKRAGLTYYLDSLQGPALLFGRVLTSGFGIDYVENIVNRLDKLGIEDIGNAAAQVFRSDDFPVTGVLLPKTPPQAPAQARPAKGAK
ncbi:MAG: pitrilysin family protein [Bdellovibrionales bacterium]|jgi:zinc protease|nr:pitrilysin family protein [Bdellovibrionales bacterium]